MTDHRKCVLCGKPSIVPQNGTVETYPEIITDKNESVSLAEIDRDISDTEEEIRVLNRATQSRQNFAAFLGRLKAARSETATPAEASVEGAVL